MNASIVSVAPLNSPSAVFQSNDDRSNKSEANRMVTVAGSVGGSLFVVLIAVLLVVYKRNRSKNWNLRNDISISKDNKTV